MPAAARTSGLLEPFAAAVPMTGGAEDMRRSSPQLLQTGYPGWSCAWQRGQEPAVPG